MASTDPRRLGGSIAGPGGPHDRDAVVVDTRNGVLLDGQEIALVETFKDGVRGDDAVALVLRGRINKTDERAEVLFLTNADGMAALVTEIVALMSRAQPDEISAEFVRTVEQRFADLRREGNV